MKKIGAILIFGGICFVFVFMGYNTFGPTTSGYAARVNNTIISIAEHNAVSNREINRYSQLSEGQLLQRADQVRSISLMVLESMITNEVITQKVKKENLLVVPAFLKDSIVSLPVFQRDGRFQRMLYDDFLQQQRFSPAQFEEKMQNDLSVNLARGLFKTHMAPTSMEVKKKWEIQNTKLNVQFVKIDPERAASFIDISSDDIIVYLKNEENLKNLEIVYSNNKKDYVSKAEVELQHILIKSDTEGKMVNENKNQSPAENKSETALAKIQSLAKRAETEDFSKLAMQFSEDPGSKKMGGNLGYITKGQLVPEFEEAAFSLDVNQISNPVKTPFGYHLIKVLNRKEALQKSFEDIKFTLAREAMIKDRIEKTIAHIKNALEKNDTETVDRLLKTLNIESWEETGLFSLEGETIPKIENSPQITKAVISLIDLPSSLYPRTIPRGKALYVIRLKEKQNPPQEAENKEQITALKSELKKVISEDVFGQWVRDIKDTSDIQRNPAVLQ